MGMKEDIKAELKALLENEQELLVLSKDNKNIFKFGTKYQQWYSRAYKIVEALAPERLSEFVSYYLIDPKRKKMAIGNYVLQDYIKVIGPIDDNYGKPLWNINDMAGFRILNQFQILSSLSSRIESVLQDVTGHLFAEIQDAELAATTQLKKISKRAAGALAGVVLERHLQRTADNHKISIGKKSPTISDLNDPLKNKGVYDIPVWRKIQLLADIRNLCSHQKATEPTDEQVDELIAGVNSIIKTVF